MPLNIEGERRKPERVYPSVKTCNLLFQPLGRCLRLQMSPHLDGVFGQLLLGPIFCPDSLEDIGREGRYDNIHPCLSKR